MHCALQVAPCRGKEWPAEVIAQLREKFLEQACTITPLRKAGPITEVTLVRHSGGKVVALSPFILLYILWLDHFSHKWPINVCILVATQNKPGASWCIWLIAKRCANGGLDFWLSIKSVSNTLSSCCFVCAFIIGQYHSGNNTSSKSGAAGAIVIFNNEKYHRIWPLKTDMLTVSAFDAFIHIHDKSKHDLSHQFVQRKYRFTQRI